MKKILLMFLGVMLTASSLKGQTTKTLTLNFDSSDFNVTYNENGEAMISSDKYDVFYDTDTLAPALPYIAVNVLIGPNEDFGSFTANKNMLSSFLSYIHMAHNAAPIPTNMQTRSWNYTEVSYPNLIYPSQNADYIGSNDIDGYRFISFKICPFVYLTGLNRILLYKSISLNITLETAQYSSGYCNNSSQNTIGYNMRNCLSDIIVNSNEIDSLYSQSTLSDTIPDMYMIITNEALKSAFQELANWKKQKGYRTVILTTEYISQHYEGNTTEQKIKMALFDYYNGTNRKLKYVLLGGDTDIVPTFIVGADWEMTPTDAYYSILDNVNWDTNNNNLTGEISDGISFSPSVFVSRLSVGNTNEAATIIERIENYEKGISLSNWEKNLLMSGCAYERYNIPVYENGALTRYATDSEFYSDQIYSENIQPYWTGKKDKFFMYCKEFDGDTSMHLHGDNLQIVLSSGYSFVNVSGHGYPQEWKLEYVPQINYNYLLHHASSLHTNANTIIVSTACKVNAIDHDTLCLSEAFMRNPYSGVLAFYGNYRSGYYQPYDEEDQKYGESDDLSAEFFKNMFKYKDNHLGEIVVRSKLPFVPLFNENIHKRHILLTLNMLGDPEMPVFIDYPKKIEGISISYLNGNVIVNTGDSCQVCITNKDENTPEYMEIRKTNQNTFSNMNGCYNLCVTKPGCIPYLATIYTSNYIQNEEIEGDTYILSDNGVQIGRNVTTLKPNGPVVIESGKTSVFSPNGTTIKNSFEVKPGAEFMIKQ